MREPYCLECEDTGRDDLGSLCSCEAGDRLWDAMRDCEWCGDAAMNAGSHARCADHDEERV